MWKSLPELESYVHGLDEINRLADVHALSTFWRNAVCPQNYSADPDWPKILSLSPEGQRIFEEQKESIARQGEVADWFLAMFGILAHHEFLIDWKRSNASAIALLLERELLAEKIRLPFRYGRVLYDRFNDVYHSNRTEHLLADDARQLLEGTPQGVYQLNRYVSGPLGILEANEPRWIRPSLTLPLWHCSDTGCTALHQVRLVPAKTGLNAAVGSLMQFLGANHGPPSEWEFALERLHRRQRWTFGRRYYDLIVVIGDCFSRT
jgi:hypothetical protein